MVSRPLPSIVKPPKPRVFIGSSKESLKYAYAIKAKLQDIASPNVWAEDIWTPGRAFLEDLIDQLPKYDFAVLILAAEDITGSRGQVTSSPRDNLIFELGLFMGYLGRSRTFFLCEKGKDLKIPSDLMGINHIPFEGTPDQADDAVDAACNTICRVIGTEGFYDGFPSSQLFIEGSGHIGEAIFKWMDLLPSARKKLARSQFISFAGTKKALMTLVESAKKTDSILAICGYKGDFSSVYYEKNFERCKAVSRVFSYEAICSEITGKTVSHALEGFKMHLDEESPHECDVEVIVIPKGKLIKDLGAHNFNPPLSFGLTILRDENEIPRKAIVHWEIDAERFRHLIAIEGIIFDDSQEEVLLKLVHLWEAIARSNYALSSKKPDDKKTIAALCAELNEIAVRLGCPTKEGRA